MQVANDAINGKCEREELEVEWGRTFGSSSEITGHQPGPVGSEGGGAAGGGVGQTLDAVDTGGLGEWSGGPSLQDWTSQGRQK